METRLYPEFMSVSEASDHLSVSPQYIRTLLRERVLRADQVGSNWVIRGQDLEQYVASNDRSTVKDQVNSTAIKKSSIKCLSFFSGALGLDLGIQNAGFDIRVCCEQDKYARRTILANHPKVGLVGDIWKYDTADFLEYAGLKSKGDVDLIIGGPPCQAFSTAGSRKGLSDERGSLIERYVNLIVEISPRFAVLENVRGLLSAPLVHIPHAERHSDDAGSWETMPGGTLFKIISLLEAGGYKVSFELYNAANFGVPQSRERLILLCTKDSKPLPHLVPTHAEDGSFNLPKWRTVAHAFEGIIYEGDEHFEFPEERLQYYRLLSSGQYWKNLPPELHREALGASLDAGGGKTGFYRRLDWNKPSCTLVTSPTMPATDICHPEENRPISIKEYMRIQQFPDTWDVKGPLKEKYRQVGNAVPVGLGRAVGNVIMNRIRETEVIPPVGFRYSRYRNTSEQTWRTDLESRCKGHGIKSKQFLMDF